MREPQGENERRFAEALAYARANAGLCPTCRMPGEYVDNDGYKARFRCPAYGHGEWSAPILLGARRSEA